MANETNSTVKLLTISSVIPEKLAEDKLAVVARWKDTANRPIAAANRNRCVILPANIWKGTEISGHEESVNQQLRLQLEDSIAELAKQYLATIVEESNWMRLEVPESHFSLPALLNWSAEQSALSGRLNGEEIRKWLAQSVTIREIHATHGEKIAGALGEQFVKLASPNHGLTPEKANKLLTTVWKADDCESNTGLRVQLRLKAISEKQTTESLLDSIL